MSERVKLLLTVHAPISTAMMARLCMLMAELEPGCFVEAVDGETDLVFAIPEYLLGEVSAPLSVEFAPFEKSGGGGITDSGALYMVDGVVSPGVEVAIEMEGRTVEPRTHEVMTTEGDPVTVTEDPDGEMWLPDVGAVRINTPPGLLKKGSFPCTEPGCDRVFDSPYKLGGHRGRHARGDAIAGRPRHETLVDRLPSTPDPVATIFPPATVQSTARFTDVIGNPWPPDPPSTPLPPVEATPHTWPSRADCPCRDCEAFRASAEAFQK